MLESNKYPSIDVIEMMFTSGFDAFKYEESVLWPWHKREFNIKETEEYNKKETHTRNQTKKPQK